MKKVCADGETNMKTRSDAAPEIMFSLSCARDIHIVHISIDMLVEFDDIFFFFSDD